MILTIGIKALNEERHIEAALRSALRAAEPFGGEVVLADSGSTDRTIEIARTFPVRIVQLADPADRSCGAGAQLAFQHARGDYFYLLDGDMVLDPDFLRSAIPFLDEHPDVAGVGGRVREVNTASEEFQIRANTVSADRNWLPGTVDRLDCGGLYRTVAIREAGHFADRNLHAFEEFELGVRLRARGWRLARLDRPAVDHFGHVTGGYALLWKRIRSGYAGAPGEVLRASIGKRHFSQILRQFSHLRYGVIVFAWWAALILGVLLSAPLWTIFALLLAPVAWLGMRRRSLALGLYSFAAWNSTAWGLVTGLFRPRVAPSIPLASRELTSPGETASIGDPSDRARVSRFDSKIDSLGKLRPSLAAEEDS